MAYCPKRGDAVWMTFDPQAGREQAGHRPALVLSPEPYNRRIGLAIVCPITNQAKGYPFEVVIPEDLSIRGVILADQVKNSDWRARSATFICTLPPEIVQEALLKINTLIAPEDN